MPVRHDILAEKENLIKLRRWFHMHPEPALEEIKTCQKITEELDKLGIVYEYIAKTAIVAKIVGKKSNSSKVVALRSDIDALRMDDLKSVSYKSKHEGLCHACGHDAHTATLIIAAKILKVKENEFSGEIRLLFQPAEEIGGGAHLFVEQGLLKDVDRVFSVHVSSRIESGKVAITPGSVQASCDYFKIDVKGLGAHVAQPERGVDALYIASQMVVNLQTIVSRNTAALESVIVGVGVLNAGTQYNIVAENAVLEGTTRTFTSEIREFTNKRVTEIINQTAKLFDGEATITWKDYAPPVINDDEVAKVAQAIAKKIYGEENVITNQQRQLGADDYALMMNEVKGVYAYVGTENKNDSNTAVAHHHGLFDIDEEALLASTQLYVDFALLHLE